MQPSVDDLQFYSGYPIDKIVQQDTVPFTVAAGVVTDVPPYPSVVQTVANSYGQKAFVTASWSIDGTNFNSSLTTLMYFNSSFMEDIPKASVNCGSDSGLIYFYLVNNFTSSLTFTINYAVYAIL